MSPNERTGWRDDSMSRRHREYGWYCATVDIDMLMVEYVNFEPRALVEYKHHLVTDPDLAHANMKVIAKLGDNYQPGAIPFFVARYWPDTWAYEVIPANIAAKRYLNGPTPMTERQYVELLHRIRSIPMPRSVSEKLLDITPPKVPAA